MALAKSMTLKEAIKIFEDVSGEKVGEAEEVRMIGMMPPIDQMNNALNALENCKKLSLSTNMIEKIGGLSNLGKLEILSLGRNNIKQLANLEPVADSLQELWISYNSVESLKGIRCLKKLRTLYMSNNKVDKWPEFEYLMELPELEDLLFIRNPLWEREANGGASKESVEAWRMQVIRKLPTLKKLDGEVITDDEREKASAAD